MAEIKAHKCDRCGVVVETAYGFFIKCDSAVSPDGAPALLDWQGELCDRCRGQFLRLVGAVETYLTKLSDVAPERPLGEAVPPLGPVLAEATFSADGIPTLKPGHAIHKCRGCQGIIQQCRCPGPHPTVYDALPCPSCRGKRHTARFLGVDLTEGGTR